MTNLNDSLITSREVRDNLANRVDVLEKVKNLLQIPGTELMTVKQVADFYEVDVDAVQRIYQRHKEEFDEDGTVIKKQSDFLSGQNGQLEKTEYSKGIMTCVFKNGIVFNVPNRGVKAFPLRAVLRIGMLLRDSAIAREVRTQLLNIEEKTDIATKTSDVDEELSILMGISKGILDGDASKIAFGVSDLVRFKNRHIEKLQNDNKILAAETLTWADRSKLNAGIRKLASETGINFSKLWEQFYKELQYKHGMNVTQRGKRPYIQHIKENEWGNAMATFAAMCEAYDKSPSDMFQQKVPAIKM